MIVSVPRFAIKLAGREYSKWNLLITQFKYTGTLPSKSSSKSKKGEKSLIPVLSKLIGRGRRNRTPIPKERRYSIPVADHPPAPAVEHRVRIELTMSCSAGSRFRQLASGANLLAGDQGFEPCR